MAASLQDKTALVTGASRGIGRAIARAFVREGAAVVICGRKPDAIARAAEEMSAPPGHVLPLVCHVGRPDDIRRLVDAANSRFGRIDILVNNAGTNIAQEPALATDEAKFDKMIEINLKSAWRLIQAVAPGMCARRSGSIINVSSIAGLRPQHHGMLYSMTKAALLMMTQAYALELGPSGVRVNAIAPGLIETALSEYFWKDEERRRQFLAGQPIARPGQPEEIAELAVLLAGDGGSFITGQTLVADGGRLLG